MAIKRQPEETYRQRATFKWPAGCLHGFFSLSPPPPFPIHLKGDFSPFDKTNCTHRVPTQGMSRSPKKNHTQCVTVVAKAARKMSKRWKMSGVAPQRLVCLHKK